MNDLQKAFDWEQISCPQFEKMLWHNTKTDVYESDGEVINKSDKRLIEYLEMAKTLKPTNNIML